MYNGKEEYASEITCPDRSEILPWDMEKVRKYTELYNENIKNRGIWTKQSSKFHGFTAEIGTTDDVNELFQAMRMKHLNASHIVCVYRLPGKNFLKYLDGEDDGEFGATRFILNAMKKHDIFTVLYL